MTLLSGCCVFFFVFFFFTFFFVFLLLFFFFFFGGGGGHFLSPEIIAKNYFHISPFDFDDFFLRPINVTVQTVRSWLIMIYTVMNNLCYVTLFC